MTRSSVAWDVASPDRLSHVVVSCVVSSVAGVQRTPRLTLEGAPVPDRHARLRSPPMSRIAVALRSIVNFPTSLQSHSSSAILTRPDWFRARPARSERRFGVQIVPQLRGLIHRFHSQHPPAAWRWAARRVIEPSATLVGIGSYHTIFRVGHGGCRTLGFWILNDVVVAQDQPVCRIYPVPARFNHAPRDQ